MPRISIIVAVDLNNAIGKDNNLLCYLPNDLKHFKAITFGKTVIMGRKTFESLPNGALPKRRNIVLTRNSDFKADLTESAHSLEEALKMLQEGEDAFIIGGGILYKEALSMQVADQLWITQIEHRFEGADTFFPEIDTNKWHKASVKKHNADDKNAYGHNIIHYQKLKSDGKSETK